MEVFSDKKLKIKSFEYRTARNEPWNIIFLAEFFSLDFCLVMSVVFARGDWMAD